LGEKKVRPGGGHGSVSVHSWSNISRAICIALIATGKPA